MPLFRSNNSAQAAVDDERKRGRDLPALLEQMELGDAAARRWAARDLGAYPQAAPELVSRTKVEPDPSVRERFSQEPFMVFGVDLALARIEKSTS